MLSATKIQLEIARVNILSAIKNNFLISVVSMGIQLPILIKQIDTLDMVS
jgi:hypothetical protein